MVLIFSTPLNFGLDSSWEATTVRQLLRQVPIQAERFLDTLSNSSSREWTPLIHPSTLASVEERTRHAFHREPVLRTKCSMMICFQLAWINTLSKCASGEGKGINYEASDNGLKYIFPQKHVFRLFWVRSFLLSQGDWRPTVGPGVSFCPLKTRSGENKDLEGSSHSPWP